MSDLPEHDDNTPDEELETPEIDILNLSDEDFAALDLNNISQQSTATTAAADTAEQEEEEEGEAPGNPLASADESEEEGQPEQTPSAGAATDENAEAAQAKPASQPEAGEEGSKPAAEIDYKAEFAKLTAPFKANGHEIQVQSVEEAISLMQMGANYNKKMAAIKPNLRMLKLLENNGLLDESKLSYLIDLDKKNPEAIKKLVKDSGIDPLDMDIDKNSEYKPTTYTVDDRELALDEVLETIQTSPTYAQLIDVVSNKWDGPSKRVIADNPQLLKVINDHMASGIYDLISKEIERERMFGRLDGLSNLQAYRQVGDALQARGAFNHLTQPQVASAPVPQKVVTPPAKTEDPAIREKRRAASPTRAVAPDKKGLDFNPLGLSDEEFAKLGNPKFI